MVPPDDQPMTHEIGKRTYVIAEVDPIDPDGVRTVAVGTALWLVLFLGLLPFYGRLRDDGHLWWLWTCLAGFGLGLAGWDFCLRRRRRRLDLEGPDGHPAGEPAPSDRGPRSGAPDPVRTSAPAPAPPAPASTPAPAPARSTARPPLITRSVPQATTASDPAPVPVPPPARSSARPPLITRSVPQATTIPEAEAETETEAETEAGAGTAPPRPGRPLAPATEAPAAPPGRFPPRPTSPKPVGKPPFGPR